MTGIGQSVTRVDALAKVKGEALFSGDINLPDQLYMKILFAGQPHAIIKHIDVTEAEKLAGVVAIFTAKDVPVNEHGLSKFDHPVLCGPGSTKPYADRVRFVGDQMAVIVGESEEIVAAARDKIIVDYERLPILTDAEEAMKQDAVLLHPDLDSNILCHDRIRKGDVEYAFSRADVIIEGEYRTPVQEHAYLQPEAGLGYIDEDGRVTVVAAGQWVHEDQEQIAHALNLPVDQVRVIYPAIGGAFGGREDISVQIALGLSAWRLHQRGIDRPVKIVWSREESIIGHGKRHPYHIYARWGATKDGKVIAADVKMIADGGAYAYTSIKVLGNATLMCTGPYEIPNVRVDAFVVYTNNIPNAAFRGFGGPQAAFEAESQMNKLAEVLNIDPVEIRMRNILREGSLLSVNTPVPPGVSIAQVLEKCAEAGGWQQTAGGWERVPGSSGKVTAETGVPGEAYLLRGRGLACSFKNVGFSYGYAEKCWAAIELHGKKEIERVVLRHAGADVGQGAHTAFAQVAAAVLDVPMEKIDLIVSDTAQTGNSGSASASRMTFMASNAIKGAAELALQKWKDEERPAVAEYIYRAPETTQLDPETGQCEPNFAYGYVAEVVDVEVDCETGEVRLLNVVCADDVGHAVNPQQVEGQIEGAVVQTMGYALMENFIQQGGYVKTNTLSTYLIPTVMDIPDHVNPLILEYPDPRGAWGIRGMGEMPYLPLVPAITAAVHDATGVWFNEFPLIPERILRGLGKL